MIRILIVIGILVIMAGLVGWLCVTMNDFEEEFSTDRVCDVGYDNAKEILTFTGGRSGTKYIFKGRCTVWHSTNGRRMDPFIESKLHDIWKFYKDKK